MGFYQKEWKIRRLAAVLLALSVLLACAPVVFAAEDSGSCGSNLTWRLSEGTLTIEGSGEMQNYYEHSMAPWYEHRGEITRLVLPEGLTSIGSLAFYDCSRLTAVDLPQSVLSVGENAFAGCEKIVMLDLGDSLQTIGDAAFYDCWGIITLRLPESLVSIGKEAFYDCRSLTTVTVPAGVKSVGSAAFAYCTSLVRAELKCSVSFLPDWIFFGCKQLTTVILPETVQSMGNAAFRECNNLYYVSYGGDEIGRNALELSISQDVPNFDTTGYLTDDRPNDTTISGTAVDNDDGTVTMQNTAVTETENATVSSTVEETFGSPQESVSAQITVTVENDSGWGEVIDTVSQAVSEMAQQAGENKTVDTQITVYVKDSESVDQSFVDTLAGRNVTVTVVTKDGSAWKIDCGEMDSRELSGTYDLRYTLSSASEDKLKQMNTQKGYLLKFSTEAQVNAELLILLSNELARQNATLFQQSDGTSLILHQTVMVDAEGYAHFYLGSVTSDSDYYIGINVPGTEEDVIIPQSLQGEFGVDYAEPVEYVITGRTSSWNMTIGQVTWILAGVMVGAVVVVGVVMYSLNKRKHSGKKTKRKAKA